LELNQVQISPHSGYNAYYLIVKYMKILSFFYMALILHSIAINKFSSVFGLSESLVLKILKMPV